MNAPTEIDKSGRLVVPKKMREAHGLEPGTRILFETHPEGLLLKREGTPRGLYRKNGALVYGPESAAGIDVLDWIRLDREERLDKIGGAWRKP